MTMRRRTFVTTSANTAAGAALVGALPRDLWHTQRRPEHLDAKREGPPSGAITLRDPRVKTLALSAVDAARQAGATYADVRITYTHQRNFGTDNVTPHYDESETLGLSVRALVDGYWGWAATSYVAPSEAPRVALAAVGLAKGNAATRQRRHVDWTPIPIVTDGIWTTPIREDPFETSILQLMDWVTGMANYIQDQRYYRSLLVPIQFSAYPWIVVLNLQRQERVFASTEGSYLTQTVYVTDPHIGFVYNSVPVLLPIRPAQAGYEYVTDTPWRELIRREMDRTDEALRHPFPAKTLEVGQYDVVLSASAMAALVARTLGTAAQVDRALGYEANARGTSYLGPDPLEFLNTPVASPVVTVTADRTAPQGLATTQWDDEGVRTEAFSLVKNGVLQDYQTTREQAAWLAPYYAQQHRPIRSHGCAAGTDALTQQMQHTPNLTLEPGKDALGIEELVSSLDDGLVVEDVAVAMDFQALSGRAHLGGVTKVRHGKRIARLGAARSAIMLRSPEFWKKVQMVGGPQSVESLYPMTSAKGEPEQQVQYSVSAVPALLKQLAVIDPTR